MYKTGIKKIDELFGGGIPAGKHVLVMGKPGTDSSSFVQQISHARIENGGKEVAFLVNDKLPLALTKFFSRVGLDIDDYLNKSFHIIDGYANLISASSTAEYVVDNPNDIASVQTKIMEAIEKLPHESVLTISSLSTMFEIGQDKESCNKGLRLIKEAAEKKNISIIGDFTDWDYEEAFIQDIKNQFDAVIELKSIGEQVILKDYYTLSKTSWVDNPQAVSVPYTIIKPGGIRVYIPKIVITGPFNAGKSSFIHSASTKATSVDRLGTTVALDHGFIDYKGFSADLFGTPGQERFDPVIEILGGEALGVIVVVDATNPDSFTRAKEMLAVGHVESLPKVVVANKADLQGALSINDIEKEMDGMTVIGTRAHDLNEVKEGHPCKIKKDDVEAVFDALFAKII